MRLWKIWWTLSNDSCEDSDDDGDGRSGRQYIFPSKITKLITIFFNEIFSA